MGKTKFRIDSSAKPTMIMLNAMSRGFLGPCNQIVWTHEVLLPNSS